MVWRCTDLKERCRWVRVARRILIEHIFGIKPTEPSIRLHLGEDREKCLFNKREVISNKMDLARELK